MGSLRYCFQSRDGGILWKCSCETQKYQKKSIPIPAPPSIYLDFASLVESVDVRSIITRDVAPMEPFVPELLWRNVTMKKSIVPELQSDYSETSNRSFPYGR